MDFEKGKKKPKQPNIQWNKEVQNTILKNTSFLKGRRKIIMHGNREDSVNIHKKSFSQIQNSIRNYLICFSLQSVLEWDVCESKHKLEYTYSNIYI